MSYEDFDVDALAAYLHLTPAQVSRLADRDKLPGRKVGGSWRFSQAEIHHWFEERIGVSDEEELVEVETVLDRSSVQDEESVAIGDLMPVEAIAIPLAARTRNSVITSMAELAVSTGLLWDEQQMAEAVRAREQLHPTALENGVALLHPRRPMAGILAEPLIALGLTSGGIPFGGARGMLTDVFFLICSTDDRGHLRTLTRLSRLISDAALIDAFRDADNAQRIHELITEAERNLN